MKRLILLTCLISCSGGIRAEQSARNFIVAEVERVVKRDGGNINPKVMEMGDEAFTVLRDIMAENADNVMYRVFIGRLFLAQDGHKLPSPGDPRVLELVREMFTQRPVPYEALRYLALKGNAEDIALVEGMNEKYARENIYEAFHDFPDQARDVLRRRVAGENMFRIWPYEAYTFAPSVTNTGPQAPYVYEILQKAWEREYARQEELKATIASKHRERAEEARLIFANHDRETADKEAAALSERVAAMQQPLEEEIAASQKIMDELRMIVVSFDADGNPVSDIDLSQYGLSMPVIEPKPQPHMRYYLDKDRIRSYTVTFPHETENPAPQPAE